MSSLIDKAIEFVRIERQFEKDHTTGISEPLSLKSRRETDYLTLRIQMSKGARGAVKTINDRSKRSIAYSVLMKMMLHIFTNGYNTEYVNLWNGVLDTMIGEH